MKRNKLDGAENQGQWMDIANDQNRGLVTIKFDAPVTFMAFSPEDARGLAEQLIENAELVERKKTQ
jgi:hypothetical protein